MLPITDDAIKRILRDSLDAVLSDGKSDNRPADNR